MISEKQAWCKQNSGIGRMEGIAVWCIISLIWMDLEQLHKKALVFRALLDFFIGFALINVHELSLFLAFCELYFFGKRSMIL